MKNKIVYMLVIVCLVFFMFFGLIMFNNSDKVTLGLMMLIGIVFGLGSLFILRFTDNLKQGKYSIISSKVIEKVFKIGMFIISCFLMLSSINVFFSMSDLFFKEYVGNIGVLLGTIYRVLLIIYLFNIFTVLGRFVKNHLIK